tara:strand:+ start:2855 stop:3226 length:372 start_codon:yes stop_codon:yes gene_type:complete
MYNTDFVCTYKQHDEEEDQDDMYRIQLLQVYNLDRWDDDVINNTKASIFNKYKDNLDMKEILNKARDSDKLSNIKLCIADDDLTIFTGLFQYELLNLIHLCICDLEKSSKISALNKSNILNNL